MKLMRKTIRMISIFLSLFFMGGLVACSQSQDAVIGIRTSHSEDNAVYLMDNLSKDKMQFAVCKEETMTEKKEKIEQSNSEEVPASYQIEQFDVIFQMPELPTGCEITAMTMALRYYGLDADKVVMATDYLPTVPLSLQYGNDGLLYGPDINQYFVGNPATGEGYICGTTAITTAVNQYLQDAGSFLRAVDKTGSSIEELYHMVSQNTPVVVWITISMTERNINGGWYTQTGEYVDWATNDHGAVLIGYTQDSVTIADPISGIVTYNREVFETVFESRGNQCVILE